VRSNPRKHVKYLVAVASILTALVAARPSVAQGTLLWQQKLSGPANRGPSTGTFRGVGQPAERGRRGYHTEYRPLLLHGGEVQPVMVLNTMGF
jgi:hypothetical protein